MKKHLVALASAALLVVPAGAAAAADAPPDEAPPEQGLVWPPAEGTGGRWLPLPQELLADQGALPACGTTVTARYADGATLEYQAEVSPTRTVLRTRATAADLVVTRADGASVVLDASGPTLETFDDVDEDGGVDIHSITLLGASVLEAFGAQGEEAHRAAGLPLLAYYTEGAVTFTEVPQRDPEAEELAYVDVDVRTNDVQDVCQLLDEAAAG